MVVSGLLAFMSVTGYAGMVNLQRLTVALLPPAEVYAGQQAPFVLRVTNLKRRFPSFLVTVVCHGARSMLVYLPSGASADLPCELTFAKRGRVLLNSVQVSSPFPVNFFVRSWRLTVSCALLVYPRLVPCWVQAGDDRGRRLSDGYCNQRGTDGDIERITEYTGRESLRQIHWKLSARSEEFKVKQYRTTAAEPLMIDLDHLPGDLEGRVSCAAWIVHHWTPERPVGLRLGEHQLQPLAGRRQMQLLLAALAIYGVEG